jgi:hypothetical protein
MKLWTAILLVACISFVACKSEKAKKYSDLIVSKQNALDSKIEKATSQLRIYFGNYEYDSIVSVSTRMENEITTVKNDIQKISAPKLKEAENFKQEALKYLDYKKNIFTTYKNYGMQTTPEARELLRNNMTAVLSQEKIMNSNLQAAQINFAKANHVKIK